MRKITKNSAHYGDNASFFCKELRRMGHEWGTLGNIRGNRNYSTANMVAKSILFLCGKISQKCVNLFGKSSRLLPNCEFFKREVIGLHKAKLPQYF